MPTSIDSPLLKQCQQIVTSSVLTPEQKRHFLALEAENALPYPEISAQAQAALADGAICDMFEGHAPYKPRYVLPDYARFWLTARRGWNSKAHRIWMMHFRCSLSCITMFHPSQQCRCISATSMNCYRHMLEF